MSKSVCKKSIFLFVPKLVNINNNNNNNGNDNIVKTEEYGYICIFYMKIYFF